MHRDTKPEEYSVRLHKVREIYYNDVEGPRFPMKAVYDSHNNTLEGVTRCLKHGAEHYMAPPPLDTQPLRDIGEEGEVEELLALENGPADVDAIDEHVALGEESDSSSDSTSTSSSEEAKRPAKQATTDRMASGGSPHARPCSRELPAELVGVPQEPTTRGASGSGLPRVGAYGEVNTARHPEPIPTIIPDDPPVAPPIPPASDEPKRPYPGVPYRGEKVQMVWDRIVDGHDGEGFPLDESGCRIRENSKRPPWISTEAWPSLTLEDRAAATKEWKDALRNQASSPTRIQVLTQLLHVCDMALTRANSLHAITTTSRSG